MTLRILAVCAGNICRSPTAEAAIRRAAETAGLEVEVDSVGTGSWNVGDPPHPNSVAAGQAAGLVVTGRARRFHVGDFDRSDMIVVMDRSNLRDVSSLARTAEDRAKVRLFRTYDPNSEQDQVPDPYGGTPSDYEAMVGMVVEAAEGLVDSLRSAAVEHSVPVD